MSTKRLAIYLLSAVAIYVFAIFVVKPLLPEPQLENLKRVAAHIQAIEPAWQQFKSTNAGFELVKFHQFTDGDGMFQVSGYLTSQVQVVRLLQFLSDTHPPRPLFTNFLKVVDSQTFETYLEWESEPGGAGNRSQPVSSETNRASAAAGPRR
jgi:hypothetical protein